jgi:hypothetical protein
MAYTTIDDPSAHFNTLLYTGNGTTGQSLTYDGNSNLQPDWLWNKVVSEADSHASWDSSRGITKILYPNLDLDEDTNGNNNIVSLDTNGVTVGGNQQYANHDGATQVSWGWRANGGTLTTNDASATGVGSIDSQYQANTTAGFSIVLYTGTGSIGSIAHGLGAVPSWMLVKNRTKSAGESWLNYHQKLTSAPETEYILTNNTAATQDNDIAWNDTAPTSTVFTVKNDDSTNDSGESFIAYIFAEKQGFSKFGEYRGNGNADGAFVYTGFKPAWLMIKVYSGNTGGWDMYDNKRGSYNGQISMLQANATAAQATSDQVDFLSNGFKIRSTSGNQNGSGNKHIYFAFAESPFVTSKGTPTTAR